MTVTVTAARLFVLANALLTGVAVHTVLHVCVNPSNVVFSVPVCAEAGAECFTVVLVVRCHCHCQIKEFPTELCPLYCGKGIGLWQLPVQFSPYLLHLSSFKVSSYL